MLNSMKCGECEAPKGTYNASCQVCQQRKRRAQQQRKRRTGALETALEIPQSSVTQLVSATAQLKILQDYFARFEDLTTNPPTPESLNQIRISLNLSVGGLERFLEEVATRLDQEIVKPIRRYRQRRSTI
jgi:hypothetical protein